MYIAVSDIHCTDHPNKAHCHYEENKKETVKNTF